MKKMLIPTLIAVMVMALAVLAMNVVQAAPTGQSATQTPRSTATPRPTRTPLSTATVRGTATATPTIGLTTTAAISGSIMPESFSQPLDVTPGRTIRVVGVGEASGAPDVATIQLGVETISGDIESALEENESRIAAILDVIDELGVDEDNVQTSNYSIWVERREDLPREVLPVEPAPLVQQQQDEDEAEAEAATPAAAEEVLLYHVTQQLTVRVEDLDENLPLIGELISGAVSAGANNVYGPNFGLSDTTALQEMARERAVASALRRAQAWAALSGVELAGIASIDERADGPSPLAFEMAAVAQDAAGSNIQRGTLTHTEQVEIIFYIR